MKDSTTSENKTKTFFRKAGLAIAVLLFWVAVWTVAALWVGKELILPDPLATLRRLWQLAGTAGFWQSTFRSLFTILLGFAVGTVFGTLLAVFTARFSAVRSLCSPMVSVVKATPVASFIILALVFLRRAAVAPFIASLMVFPILWGNVSEGIRNTDPKLLEKAKVYGVPGVWRVRYIYIPQVFPYFRAGVCTALGLAWKAGVAAEVLGTPTGTIGEKLRDAQIYLETADLFAWTVVVIVMSMVVESLLKKLMQRVALHDRVHPSDRKAEPAQPAGDVTRVLTRSFGDKEVLRGTQITLPERGVTALTAPSGGGKTTVLRMLCGLETASDGADMSVGEPCAYLFQEDRLLPQLSVAQNILLVDPAADAETLLKTVELEQEADSLPTTLSGGMQRRAALAVMLARVPAAALVLMDEPFRGLDDAMRDRIAPRIFDAVRGKRVVLVSHAEEEIERYADHVIRLKS